MALTEPITPLSQAFIKYSGNISLGLEFEKGYNAKESIEIFSRSVAGFHFKAHGDKLKFHTKPIPIVHLPDTFKSIKEATTWATRNIRLDPEEHLALIAHNDHQSVLLANHSVADGGFMKYLASNYGKIPHEIPTDVSNDLVIYKDEIRKAKPALIPDCEPKLPRFNPQKPTTKNITGFDYYPLVFPAESLASFDKDRNSVKSLSEHIYASTYLAACAFEKKLLPFAGASVVIDTRRFLKNPPTLEDSNHGAVFTTTAPVVPGATIGSIGSLLRKNLLQSLNRGELFGFYKNEQKGPLISGLFPTISSVGCLKLKKPVVDAWIGLSMDGKEANDICTLAYSVMTEKKHDFILCTKYHQNTMSTNDAETYASIVSQVLKNIPQSTRVEDAFNEVKDMI